MATTDICTFSNIIFHRLPFPCSPFNCFSSIHICKDRLFNLSHPKACFLKDLLRCTYFSFNEINFCDIRPFYLTYMNCGRITSPRAFEFSLPLIKIESCSLIHKIYLLSMYSWCCFLYFYFLFHSNLKIQPCSPIRRRCSTFPASKSAILLLLLPSLDVKISS